VARAVGWERGWEAGWTGRGWYGKCDRRDRDSVVEPVRLRGRFEGSGGRLFGIGLGGPGRRLFVLFGDDG
jgi:hypothetical protein